MGPRVEEGQSARSIGTDAVEKPLPEYRAKPSGALGRAVGSWEESLCQEGVERRGKPSSTLGRVGRSWQESLFQGGMLSVAESQAAVLVRSEVLGRKAYAEKKLNAAESQAALFDMGTSSALSFFCR